MSIWRLLIHWRRPTHCLPGARLSPPDQDLVDIIHKVSAALTPADRAYLALRLRRFIAEIDPGVEDNA